MKTSKVRRKIKSIFFNHNCTIIIGSGQKVGSTWLYQIVSSLEYFKIKNIDYYSKQNEVRRPAFDFSPKLKEYLLSEKHATVLKTHNYPKSDYQNHSNILILNIYRDPRDVIVSTINYLSWLPVEEGGWGSEFAQLDFKEKFMKFIGTDWHLSILERWHCNNDVYKIKYEELKDDPFSVIISFLREYNIPHSDKEIREIIEEFEFKKQRKKAIENKDKKGINFLKSGTSFQWKKMFDDDMKTVFKNHERWNNLLIGQNYESNNLW